MGALWYWIVAVMLAMYVVFDGFDLGVGILLPFVARRDEERQQALRSVGPVWVLCFPTGIRIVLQRVLYALDDRAVAAHAARPVY